MYPRRREQMTTDERRRGWVFFAAYTFILPWLVGLVRFAAESIWAFSLGDAAANLIYHLLVTILLGLVFWTYLETAWKILREFLPENLIALGIGLMIWISLRWLVGLLPLPLTDPTGGAYAMEFSLSPIVTVIVYVLLMPIAEEVLYRGLLFGTIKQRHRVLAYVITVVVFALSSVWPLAISAGDLRYFWNALEYVPMALALCWCYDKGGSIYTPIILHWVIHAVTLVAAL